MNAAVLTLRAVVTQMKRLALFRKQIQTEGVEEDELPSDASRLEALQVDGLLGTAKGSALAMWYYVPASKTAKIDIVIGDDVADQGPYAEEIMVRQVARKAA